jgi:uncharacterized phage protein (TIGR02218 family)
VKILPSALQQLLSGNGRYLMADCVVIRQAVPTAYLLPGSGSPCSVQTESVGNILLALTNADVDILIQPDNAVPTNCTFLGTYLPQGVPAAHLPSGLPSGSIYCSAIPMDRSKLSLKCGLGVDSTDITIYPRPSDVLYGTTLQDAARTGIFDGSTVDMFRVFWSPGANPTGGGVVYFAGRIGEIEFGRSMLKLPVNSFTELLNLDFPRNVYQPYCQFVLYGAGCCVNKANFTFFGAVGSSPNPTNISFQASGISQADHYFDQGVLTFTSGILSGLTVTVKSWANDVLTPFLPLPSAPASGDSLTLYAGCDRTWTTCQNKFSNGANFGGMPFIPIPDTMLAPIVQQSSGAGK